MSKDIDQEVLTLLNKIKNKKKEIESNKENRPWKTNLTIGFDPESPNRMNILTVRDMSKILEMYSFLLVKKEFLEKAVASLFDDAILSGKHANLNYMGYPIEDWLYDLKTKAIRITLDEKRKELDKLEEKVNSLVSVEQRRELELEELKKYDI